MSKHWVEECWWLAVGTVIAIIAGAITGLTLWFLAAFLLGYSVWMIFRFHELERWIKEGSIKEKAPDTLGIAAEIMQLIYRDKKSSLKQKQRLRASLTQFNDMAAELPDATVVLDENYQIKWCNSAASTMLGISRSRDSGQRIDNLVRHPDFHEFLADNDSNAELELPAPTNSKMTIAFRRVQSGESMSILSGRDVSQRVIIREMRRTFVANVSHELRTPLTVIQGYLEVLSDTADIPPEARAALESAAEQSDRMGNIVSDLLTLSRLESSHLSDSEGVPIDVADIVNSAIKDASQISPESHTFLTEIEPDLMVNGNMTEVFSACQNLIQNAIRYTPSGTVITVGWKRHEEGSVFFVRDTGPGIEAHHLPRLSERFYRVDESRSRENGGTGLGLAIVKYIAQRHGGFLDIQSQVGVGSTFEIHFPASRTLRIQNSEPKAGFGGGN